MGWLARRLWGVVLISGEDAPILLGSLWVDCDDGERYPGEPTRALLFCTRQLARAWCAEKQRSNNQPHWKFRPVRVTESVRLPP